MRWPGRGFAVEFTLRGSEEDEREKGGQIGGFFPEAINQSGMKD